MGSTAAVLRGRMGLRGPDEKQGQGHTMAFRCPAEVRSYLESEAASSGRTMSRVIVEAIELDRDLVARLTEAQARLAAYAEESGLSLRTELGEVLARLVREALEARAAARRPAKK